MILDSVHSVNKLHSGATAVRPPCRAAHDIPSDRRCMRSSARAAHKLQVIVRAPLGAIRDIDFPRTSADTSTSKSLRRCCRTPLRVQIAGPMDIYEGAARCCRSRKSPRRRSHSSPTVPSIRSPKHSARSGTEAAEHANLIWNQVFSMCCWNIRFSRTVRFFIRPGFERLAAES